VSAPLTLDPELVEAIRRGRERAEAAGEIGPGKPLSSMPVLSEAARLALIEWKSGGSFHSAVQAIGEDDRDLADE
jgi:hypothetical protein